MDVRNCLTCVFTIVDDQSVSAAESLLFGDLGSRHKHFAQNGLVLLLGLGDTGESVLVFGDDDDVSGRNGGDIAEGKDVLILEDHGAWDLLVDELVEDRLFGHKQLQSSPIAGLSYENAKGAFLGRRPGLKKEARLGQLSGRLCGDFGEFYAVFAVYRLDTSESISNSNNLPYLQSSASSQGHQPSTIHLKK